MPVRSRRLRRGIYINMGRARLVDVRTAPEVRYVGCVPGALHVEWHGTDAQHVERFVQQLKAAVQPR